MAEILELNHHERHTTISCTFTAWIDAVLYTPKHSEFYRDCTLCHIYTWGQGGWILDTIIQSLYYANAAFFCYIRMSFES